MKTAKMDWKHVYRNRRVLLTGHSGFKGSWLSLWLAELGAETLGYSLNFPSDPCLFEVAQVGKTLTHVEGDVCDMPRLRKAWADFQPEIVFHLAGQPIVRESYRNPMQTIQTNIFGTVSVLELAREMNRPLAMVVITSDKAYRNNEWVHAYREDDRLGGHDIYSMSKGAADLAVHGYQQSFFAPNGKPGLVSAASARAGNVIGGGDWAAERIVPDCVRSIVKGDPILVRNPHSIRPWQHVLEPLSGYLSLGARLLSDDPQERLRFSDAWNFGPSVQNTRTVGQLVESMIAHWGAGSWQDMSEQDKVHEDNLLKLAIDKAFARLHWEPRWDFESTMRKTAEWYKAFYAGDDMLTWCKRQIAEYCDVD